MKILQKNQLQEFIGLFASQPQYDMYTQFLGTIPIVYTDNIFVAAISEKCLYINPKAFSNLQPEEKVTVLAHEICHIMFNHLAKSKGKILSIYNRATDHVINLSLIDEGFKFTGILEEGCFEDRFRGMNSEQVYKILYDEQINQENVKPDPPISSSLPSSSVLEKLDEDFQNEFDSLDSMAQTSISSKIKSTNRPLTNQTHTQKELFEKEFYPLDMLNVPYKQIFKNHFKSIGQKLSRTGTYSKPSRRNINSSLIPKGTGKAKKTQNTCLDTLVYALDVSGSIDKKDVQFFLDSAKTIKHTLNPKKMIIVTWNHSISETFVFTDKESIDIDSLEVGGATCCKTLLQTVSKRYNPSAIVIYTDLCFKIPSKPEYPVYWFVPCNNEKTYISDQHSNIGFGELYLFDV